MAISLNTGRIAQELEEIQIAMKGNRQSFRAKDKSGWSPRSRYDTATLFGARPQR